MVLGPENILYFIVFYCLSIAGIIIMRGLYVGSPKDVFDSKNSYIICDNGTKILFPDTHSQLNEYDKVYGQSDYDFRRLCLPEEESRQIVDLYDEKVASLDSDLDIGDETNAIYKIRLELIEQMPVNYKFVNVEKVVGSWPALIINLILIALAVPIMFEIIRRIFYLIVLKKPFPKKK